MSKFDKMCLPAKLYLILSMISIASMFFFNLQYYESI